MSQNHLQVKGRVGKAKNIPQQRTELANLVDIKARIDLVDLAGNGIEDLAILNSVVVGVVDSWWVDERFLGRKLKSILDVRIVPACLTSVMQKSRESIIEGKVILVGLNEGKCCYLGRDLRLNARIVDHHSIDIKVGGVVLFDHCRRDVWAVHAGVGLASDIDFSIVQIEEIHEVLPEGEKLGSDVKFVGCVWSAFGESGADGSGVGTLAINMVSDGDTH